jgi:integrase
MQAISEKIVGNLPIPPKGNKLHYFSGASLQGKKAPSGFAVRITSAGTRAFVWFHRVNGKPHLETLGRWDENAGGGSLTVRDAIIRCTERAKAVARGTDRKGNEVDPRPARTRRLQEGDRPKGETVSGLLDKFVERYVKKEKKLRTADQIEATFDRLVKPKIGKFAINDVRRTQLIDMLDDIADNSGPVMADRVLALTRKAFNWHTERDPEFKSPLTNVKARIEAKSRMRLRYLKDDEIRDLWAALSTVDAPDCYVPFVKTLLLTATRRNEAADMNKSELDGDVWLIPAARYKTSHKIPVDHVIPLSAMVCEAIGDVPKKARFIFSTTGGEKSFSGFSKAKTELDKTLAAIRESEGREPMENWTLHDLRRTARTLLARAGIRDEIAERCLGHVPHAMIQNYNCYDYLDEKRAAFEALAALVSRILNPTANVEELASRRAVTS